MITHYDLFAGIGGFSLALEEVFKNDPIRHIFCEWESFPTAVLKQHWPEAIYYGDIADLVADTECKRRQGCSGKDPGRCRQLDREIQNQEQGISIVTGGFPCQPFSHAGRRKGTADDRYQWPNMFQVIRNVKPEWVIAENVRGLVTWNDGMVLEQVCSDLESEGYEVQPFIIPAVAVGAPHRRDRVWIIARRNADCQRLPGTQEIDAAEARQSSLNRIKRRYSNATNTRREYGESGARSILRPEIKDTEQTGCKYPDWSRDWREVATSTCVYTVDDGISRELDGTPLSYSKWRKESLKAYGNAICPQVAMQIFEAIKLTERKP